MVPNFDESIVLEEDIRGKISNFFKVFNKTQFNYSLVCRLALKSTDVNWSKKKDPIEVMQGYENKQFKMFNMSGIDHSNLSTLRNEPKYR